MSSFYKLPKVEVHKDPFDRIIIWKCINDSIILVSQDRKFPEYEKFKVYIKELKDQKWKKLYKEVLIYIFMCWVIGEAGIKGSNSTGLKL